MQTDIRPAAEIAGLSPRVHRIELAIFLLLIVPSMVLSFFAVRQGALPFWLTATATIFRDLGLVSLILFFAWRNRESLKSFGLTPGRGLWREIGLGVLLFVPLFFATDLLQRLFVQLGLSVPSGSNPIAVPSQAPIELILAMLLVVVVAFSEELIFRGYLIRRFGGSGLGTAAAVILATVVFAVGHGYEGTAGVATVGVMGLVFALVYLWRKSLTASMTMHFLQDFLVIVALPLLLRR
jgi:membrane protease YdiL (CAAX protease family)